MDPFLLDMVIVVVVVAESFFAEVGMFEGVLMGRVTAAAGDKDVELVCGVGVRAEEAVLRTPTAMGHSSWPPFFLVLFVHFLFSCCFPFTIQEGLNCLTS
jgi:hypothetical protein